MTENLASKFTSTVEFKKQHPAEFQKWHEEYKKVTKEYAEIDGHRMVDDVEPGETRYFMYDNEWEEVPVKVIGTEEIGRPTIQVLRKNNEWDDGWYILSNVYTRQRGIREVKREEIAHLLPAE